LTLNAVGEDIRRQAMQRQSIVVDLDYEILCDKNSNSGPERLNSPPNIEVDGLECTFERMDGGILE
jgi:hypothetical protein